MAETEDVIDESLVRGSNIIFKVLFTEGKCPSCKSFKESQYILLLMSEEFSICCVIATLRVDHK